MYLSADIPSFLGKDFSDPKPLAETAEVRITICITKNPIKTQVLRKEVAKSVLPSASPFLYSDIYSFSGHRKPGNRRETRSDHRHRTVPRPGIDICELKLCFYILNTEDANVRAIEYK